MLVDIINKKSKDKDIIDKVIYCNPELIEKGSVKSVPK